MILAGIDIGSNAMRLIIKNVEERKRGADFKKLAYLRVPIRLGEDVFTAGKIGEEKADRFMYAMQGFSSIIKAYKVDSYRACATSAMRDAENGSLIAADIDKQTGIKIEIISGIEEAEMIYHAGDFSNELDNDKTYLYVDVGGGSTEIIIYSDMQLVKSSSFQMGTVRFLTNAVNPSEQEKMLKWLDKLTIKNEEVEIIGSGGNINKLHKMLGKRDGEPLTSKELFTVYDKIKDADLKTRKNLFGLNDYRADVIEPALRIFTMIAEKCDVKKINVPKIGLADGIINYLWSINHNLT